jgi:hypothetical protein
MDYPLQPRQGRPAGSRALLVNFWEYFHFPSLLVTESACLTNLSQCLPQHVKRTMSHHFRGMNVSSFPVEPTACTRPSIARPRLSGPLSFVNLTLCVRRNISESYSLGTGPGSPDTYGA